MLFRVPISLYDLIICYNIPHNAVRGRKFDGNMVYQNLNSHKSTAMTFDLFFLQLIF